MAVTPIAMRGVAFKYYTVQRGGILYQADGSGNLTQVRVPLGSVPLAGADPLDVMDLIRSGCILTSQTAWN